jgi:hypothetical protein
LVSAELVALIVTVAGLGTPAGAVYKPDEVTVPMVELPPAMLFTDQVITVLVELTTVAVNCMDDPAGKEATEGDSVIVGNATLL